MANYTAELKSYVEAGAKIFNFDYEFYDESKRDQFEQNFIRHFYFREIGCETLDRFRWYLEDKMRTVFPYYNELFKAAQIKYNILDNYNVREEYEITREGVDKTKGVSSTVGRVMDEQTSEVNDTRNGESSVTSTGNGSRIDKETIDTDTTNAQTETGERTTTAEGSKTDKETVDNDTSLTRTDTGTSYSEVDSNRTTSGEGNVNTRKTTEDETKFLDTPQGLLTLEGANYLTNLTAKNGTESNDTISSENGLVSELKKDTGNHENTVTDTGTNDTERNLTSEDERSETSAHSNEVTGTGSTDTARDLTSTTTQKDTTTGSDQSEGKTTGSYQAEQKTTHDNNTRTERLTDHIEKSVYTKKGNIGIDTDSDMITKHINLQKVLKNIERMFFDECEDLFMLVY